MQRDACLCTEYLCSNKHPNQSHMQALSRKQIVSAPSAMLDPQHQDFFECIGCRKHEMSRNWRQHLVMDHVMEQVVMTTHEIKCCRELCLMQPGTTTIKVKWMT